MDELRSEHFLMLYDKLRTLARRTLLASGVHLTLDPTDLVHEAWLKLRAGETARHWTSDTHFYAAAAETMRHLLVDRTRRKWALKHGGDFTRRPLEYAERVFALPVSEDICFLRLHTALESLKQESISGARVIDLKYFTGLSNTEVGLIMELNEPAVRRLWTWARVRLFQLYQELERLEFSGDNSVTANALN
ncbi:MAG: ECF-type sigma factor [Planctomycetia bacterium]